MTSFINATYRFRGTADEVRARARAVAYEQTVELPPALVPDAVRETVVARVGAPRPAGSADLFDVQLRYPAELACGQLSQLVNLVYGNVSLLPGVRLVDLQLPDALLGALPGPRFGVDGLRHAVGVDGRPLLATAIKPRGLSVDAMAGLAGAFAAGGGDLIKDDQNLNDPGFEAWYERVARCAEAVAGANARRARPCLYAPHLAGPPQEVERRATALRGLGLGAVLVSPMILGLDAVADLGRRHGLILLAHPAGAGGSVLGPDHGVTPEILLGTLFRLAGADVSIFPNAGGRFQFGPDVGAAIGRALRAPLGDHPTSFPAPAGGMGFDRIDDMAAHYGPDTVFLVGGALLGADDGLEAATARFVDRLRDHFGEEERVAEAVSSCELPADAASVRSLIRQIDGYEWEDRPSTRYKDDDRLPFRGVRRVELVGPHGERTAFHLRYFEVEPGGHTSREKHVHTHTIIGARGRGVLERGDERQELGVHDVAYVAPLEVHRLRNETEEPFGFYCIVDRERDRPQAP